MLVLDCGMRGAAIAVTLALLAGCAPVLYRTAPDYPARLHGNAVLAVMPIDVHVYRTTIPHDQPEGPIRFAHEPVTEWSEQAHGNLAKAIATRALADQTSIVRTLDAAPPREVEQELDDVRPMFEAVALCFLLHGVQGIAPIKTDLRGYSVGPLPAIRAATGADALLFVHAIDHVLGSEIHLLNAILAIFGSSATVPTGSWLGPMTVPTPGGAPRLDVGANLLVAALVEPRSGDLLWLTWRGWPTGVVVTEDLRKASSAERLVREVFDDLAASRRKQPR
jgi:hypothetical protein